MATAIRGVKTPREYMKYIGTVGFGAGVLFSLGGCFIGSDSFMNFGLICLCGFYPVSIIAGILLFQLGIADSDVEVIDFGIVKCTRCGYKGLPKEILCWDMNEHYNQSNNIVCAKCKSNRWVSVTDEVDNVKF